MARQMPPQGSDLPQHAFERLNMMRGNSNHRGLFTSDLSANEFLLVKQAGFDPVPDYRETLSNEQVIQTASGLATIAGFERAAG